MLVEGQLRRVNLEPLVRDGEMDANQLRERLGRSDRGNRDGTGRRMKIGVRSRDRPRSWESRST